MAEVHIPIPEPTDVADTYDRQTNSLQFTGKPFMKLQGFGPNTPPTVEKWISGILKLRASWGVNNQGQLCAPPETK